MKDISSQTDVNWLVLDLNSFFASCEQQENPRLRGKLVGIVPMENVDTTCILAASHEAKKLGIKTGTPVGEAKIRCPDIILMKASHKTYVKYHHEILKAIDLCTPIEKVLSIDEVACRMTGSQCNPDNAVALAKKIKETIKREVGDCLTSSIGISTNTLLAKFASDMQKPDGLQVIRPCDLPHKILSFKPRDFCGIGPAMEKRLNAAGIFSMKDLYACDRHKMRRIWGGVEGERFYAKIWGHQVERTPTQTSVIGHQHVLEPHLRNIKGASDVLHHLLIKGSERLRHMDYFCKYLSVDVKLDRYAGYWQRDTRFVETQDSQFLLRTMNDMWRDYPGHRPLRVGITLSGLVPSCSHQGDLFAKHRPKKLFDAIDGINSRFGRHSVTFGLNNYIQERIGTDKIAFQRVPEVMYL